MSPKWFIGFLMLFVLCSLISSVIEKQDIMASGNRDKTTLDELFAFTELGSTDALGNTVTVFSAGADTLHALRTVFFADYSFTHDNFLGFFMQLFLWTLGLGFILFLILYLINIRVNL